MASAPVPYLLTISLRILKEPLIRMRASWREPYNGVPLIFTNSSPVLIFWDKAALPPSSICVVENKTESRSWGDFYPIILLPDFSQPCCHSRIGKLFRSASRGAEELIIGHWVLKAENEQALEKGGDPEIRRFLHKRSGSSGKIAFLKEKVILGRSPLCTWSSPRALQTVHPS